MTPKYRTDAQACSCRGFWYRKTCRHWRAYREAQALVPGSGWILEVAETSLYGPLGRAFDMRQRRTQEQMETLRSAIYAVAETDRPVSIRHIFYRMVVLGLVEKTNKGYQQLQKTTVDMRDDGALPYAWIEDSSRRAYWNNWLCWRGQLCRSGGQPLPPVTIGTLTGHAG